MASIMRSFTRVPRARFMPSSVAMQPKRYASSSYGNEQSGQEQGTHEKNPKVDMEHPGPEAPATKGKSGESSSGSSQPASGSSDTGTSGGAQPKISDKSTPKEDADPEVKKHNDEMKNRADRSANQLSEEDQKVDKKYWQGNVGNQEK